MGLASGRMRNPDEVANRFGVIDTFAMKAEYGLGWGDGLVVVLDSLLPSDAKDLADQLATIQTPTGRTFSAQIGATKKHGAKTSLFFEGLRIDDVPVGSEVFCE